MATLKGTKDLDAVKNEEQSIVYQSQTSPYIVLDAVMKLTENV